MLGGWYIYAGRGLIGLHDATLPDLDVHAIRAQAPDATVPDLALHAIRTQAPDATLPDLDAHAIRAQAPDATLPDLGVHIAGERVAGRPEPEVEPAQRAMPGRHRSADAIPAGGSGKFLGLEIGWLSDWSVAKFSDIGPVLARPTAPRPRLR